MFIIDDRDLESDGWERYLAYLTANEDRFPPNALELGRSDWYHSFREHRAPHDSRLLSASFTEVPAEPGETFGTQVLTLELRLRGAYDDGDITVRYPDVSSYELLGGTVGDGHRDWRFDEFRIDDEGRLVHEISWYHLTETARWTIIARDIELGWHPDPA